jgi:nucleoside-diphosphate-sugar epimerase
VKDVGIVVHLAARVHVMRDTAADPLTDFRIANTAGTERLARQAAAAGVKRFVYLSSIKVNGEETRADHPFTEQTSPRPQDPYGVSKHEAEVALRRVADETGIEVVVIRPPLIYGPRVQANFRRMMGWVRRGIPLPFGAIENRRTLVALDNLVDLIIIAATHTRAGNETFLAGDGEDLSTPSLLTRLGLALGTRARLIPVPQSVVELGLGLIGQRQVAERLCGSLQVDISKAKEHLGWTPPVSVDEGLHKAAADFLSHS